GKPNPRMPVASVVARRKTRRKNCFYCRQRCDFDQRNHCDFNQNVFKSKTRKRDECRYVVYRRNRTERAFVAHARQRIGIYDETNKIICNRPSSQLTKWKNKLI